MLSLGTLPLHHIAIKVNDLAVCETFYHQVLGLKIITHQRDAQGQVRSTWLELGGAILMLEKTKKKKKVKALDDPGHYLVAFQIKLSQRQSWHERLVQHQVDVSHTSNFSLYFADPEGNRLALSHHPDPLNQVA